MKPSTAKAKGRKSTPLVEKFYKWVDVGNENECWLFHGGARADGYGLLSYVEAGRKRAMLAHRWAFSHFVRPLVDGELVLHSCDTPLCCNPAHLRAGSASDNMRDMVERKRHPLLNVTHCPKGHEYNFENTYVRKSGARQCRVCDREYQLRKYYERKAPK